MALARLKIDLMFCHMLKIRPFRYLNIHLLDTIIGH